MARPAKTTKDDANWRARMDAKRTKADALTLARSQVPAKSFNSMSRGERDTVLLLAAKMLGIIED